jgi:hypothetical protein
VAVDLFSLVMRVKAEGAAAAVADLRNIDAAGKQAALGATNFANAWQGALLQFKGSAAQIAEFKAGFSKGFFDDKLVAGMSLAGQEGRRASEGNAAMSRGIAESGRQWRESTVAVQQKTGALSLLGAALRPMIALYAGFSLFNFIKHTIAGAGALHEMAQRTGASVRMLSILEFAGKQSGVSVEMLAVGFRGLALSLGNLRDGNEKTVAAFQRIGISAQELKGLSVDQVFQKIVEKLALMPDGFDKAEAAQRIFGRSGAAMLPLLEDLAERGFANVAREAASFGAVIDANAARKADAFGDAITRLKVSMMGLFRDVMMPLLPFLTAFVDGLSLAVRHINALATGGLANFGFAIGRDLAGGGAGDFSGVSGGGSSTAGRIVGPFPTRSGRSGAGSSIPGAPGMAGDLAEFAALAPGIFAPDSLGSPAGIGTRDDRINVSGALGGAGKRPGQRMMDLLRQDMFEGIQRLKPVANGLHALFQNLFTGGRLGSSIKSFGQEILSGMGSIFAQMAMRAIAAAPLFIAIGKAMSNPFTAGFALLAFGVALKALGSAMGGEATGGGGGGGGGSAGMDRDRTTNITLTADGAGGFKAPKRDQGQHFTVIGASDPRAHRIIGDISKAGARRNI